jgi:adenylylsulfate kinase-like enzyme
MKMIKKAEETLDADAIRQNLKMQMRTDYSTRHIIATILFSAVTVFLASVCIIVASFIARFDE